MPQPKRTLLVHANPWAYMDHQGRPAGACPMDMPAGVKRFVGAKVCPERTTILRKTKAGDLQDGVQDTVWVFERAAVSVPDSPYYRKRLRGGEIIPADAVASRAAGFKSHTNPREALAAAKAAAGGADALFSDDQPEAKEPEAKPAQPKGSK